MSIENNEIGIDERSEDQPEKIVEDVNEKGVPLYMAFLADPNAITVSKEEVQDAKNLLLQVQTERPEVIEICKHSSIPECVEAFKQAA